MGGGAETLIEALRKGLDSWEHDVGSSEAESPSAKTTLSDEKSFLEKPAVFEEASLEMPALPDRKPSLGNTAVAVEKLLSEKSAVSEGRPSLKETTVSEGASLKGRASSGKPAVSEDKPSSETTAASEEASSAAEQLSPTSVLTDFGRPSQARENKEGLDPAKGPLIVRQLKFLDQLFSEKTVASKEAVTLVEPPPPACVLRYRGHSSQARNNKQGLGASKASWTVTPANLGEKPVSKRNASSKEASSVVEQPTPISGWRSRGNPSQAQDEARATTDGLDIPTVLQSDFGPTKNTQDGLMRQAIVRNKEILTKKAKDLPSTRKEIQAYCPGQKLLVAGDRSVNDYVIPQKTVLLLVGDMGVGKSTLVNNIHRAVNNTRSDLDIAATARSTTGSHSLLLQEYAITPRVLIFDTRGLSVGNTAENVLVLKEWIKDGVRDSQPVLRSSDGQESKEAIVERSRLYQGSFCQRRVNFAIYVLNAVTVHSIRVCAQSGESQRMRKIYGALHQFRDHSPIVVMTHGDQLSKEQRDAARGFLADTLGIDAGEFVFDIASFTGREQEENEVDPLVDAAILTMLQQALKLADRSLPSVKGVAAANSSPCDDGIGACLAGILGALIVILMLVGFTYLLKHIFS